MNTVELLSRQAAARPQQPAIIGPTGGGGEDAVSFAELERVSQRASSALRAAGLRPGDAVLVLVRISVAMYEVVLGVLRMGGIVMLLDPSAGLEHVRRCCRLRPPDALVAEPKAHLLRLLSKDVRAIPHKFSVRAWLPGSRRWDPSAVAAMSEDICPRGLDAPALLTFTSGSTGQPKAAIRTHGFLAAQHRALARSLDLTAGETDLTTLPVFVLANLASGVTSLLPDADTRRPGRINPVPLIRQILRHRPATTAGSPALLERLTDECRRRGVALPFRSVFTGGAPVFPRAMHKLREAFPQSRVVGVYGSTEAEPIAKIALDQVTAEDEAASLRGAGLLAGKPVDAIDLRILPDRWNQTVGPYTSGEFESLCLPAGQAGEIVVTGEHVLKGYLHGEGDAETKFRVNAWTWHRTGDAGYLDSDGRLWLLGRCAARVDDQNGTIYPFAVEAAAHSHPAIGRAALVCRHGRRALVVQPLRGLSRTETSSLVDELKASLAWAHIDSVWLIGKIPVDARHNAKTDYPTLMRMLDRLPWRSHVPQR